VVGARHPAALLIAVCVALTATGCKAQRSRVTVQNEEPPPGSRLLSTIQMNDANAAPQLLSGFYAVENNAWRWTAGRFSVSLRIPPAARSGATVSLSLTVPDVVIQKLGKVRVSASVGGMELKAQEYDSPGPYVFKADIPAGQVPSAESVTVDFAVNGTFRPDGDKRDLAIVANSVSIAAK